MSRPSAHIPEAALVGLVVPQATTYAWAVATSLKAALQIDLPGVTARLLFGGTAWQNRVDVSRLVGFIGFFSDDDMDRIERLNVPAVNFNSARVARCPSVIPDHQAIGRVAGQHLLACGYRRFAYIGYAVEAFASDRFEGFAEAVQPTDPMVESIIWDGQDMAWLDAFAGAPVGVFASGDWAARRLCEAAVEHGKHVPRDVAIVGVNDEQRLCELAPVPLSSVDIAVDRLARQCVRQLTHLLEGGRPWSIPIRVQPHGVVERASTGEMVFHDPDVRAAMQFIRQHAGESINVEDVMQRVRVSRRTLEMRFRDQLGKTIRRMIEQYCFEHAQQLLRGTALPVGEVALRCGFKKHSRFTSQFHKLFGQSPTDYRKQATTGHVERVSD